ncbi:MAG TPA: glycosyltransferase family 2 protein [Aquifex aeolicus]|nr:glycosyltransferase family 2 protein [Aquifex aeolicus]
MLSVLIRTKNEIENIERAINSVRNIAQEIIVLDDGSTDGTVEKAKSLGAKVFNLKEKLNYPEKLNYGINLCKNEWIFILDADEEVSEELRDSIISELKNPKFKAYEVTRKTYYLGKFLNHAWYPEWRLRLFKKGTVYFEGEVHEKPVYKGKIGRLKGDLFHYSFKSLKHQYLKNVNYAYGMALYLFKNGKRFRFYNLIFNPIWSFTKVFFLKLGFLDGFRGFLVAVSAFIYTFLKYLFLLELELKEKYGENLWRRKNS